MFVAGKEGSMNKKSDGEIKNQVLRELKWDARIAWSTIGVEVIKGVVKLTGVVSSYAQKLAARTQPIALAGC